MGANNEHNSYWVSLEEVIKASIIDCGENDNSATDFFLHWATRGYRQFNWDILGNIKRVWLPVSTDSSNGNKTAELPTDFVNYCDVGFEDKAHRFVPLGKDDSLVPAVKKNTTHQGCGCSCGCTDPVCSATGNVSVTKEDIVLNGVTYQKVTKVCLKGSNMIVEVCTPQMAIDTSVIVCTYNIEIHHTLVPFTLTSYTKNHAVVTVNVVMNTIDEMDAYFAGLGFTVVAPNTYQVVDSENSWQSVTVNMDETTNFVQTNCHNGMTVETICETTTQCSVETKECGCVIPTPQLLAWCKQINISCFDNWGWYNSYYNPAEQYPYPLARGTNVFGYYRVEPREKKIYLSQGVVLDFIILYYYSNGDLIDNDLMIPVQCFEALTAYCKWMYKESKTVISMTEKERAKKNYDSEFSKAQRRLNPIRINEILQSLRQPPRP